VVLSEENTFSFLLLVKDWKSQTVGPYETTLDLEAHQKGVDSAFLQAKLDQMIDVEQS